MLSRAILLALAIPAAAFSQLSHPVMASRDDVSLTPKAGTAFPDTVRILAVRVQFQIDNEPRTTGNGQFDLSVPTAPVLDSPPHDRQYVLDHLEFLANYYRRASKGRLVVLSSLLDSVLTLPATLGSYSPPQGGSDSAVGNLARDTWHLADSLGLVTDFSQYKSFVVIHAGAGRDIDLVNSLGYDPTPLDIPSLYLGPGAFRNFYGESYQGIPVQGGTFHITNSIVIPETETRSIPGVGGDVPLVYGINGLLCASLGNFLGLPDLFDTKTGLTGIGRFGLMDGQSIFSFNGAFPPEPSAWERYWLGWISPIVVPPGSHTVTLPAVSLADTIYRVPISNAEYFLVENRNRNAQGTGLTVSTSYRGVARQRTFPRDTADFYAFDLSALSGDVIDVSNPDWSLPGGVATDGTFYDGGVLIWHIDESVILPNLASDAVNADPAHRGVDLLEADGSQDIGQQYDILSLGAGSEFGTELDFWFQGNSSPVYKNELSASTFPSSAANNGAQSHVAILGFSPRGPRMSATIVRGDAVAPLGSFPLSTNEDLAAQQITVADAGGGRGIIGVVATNGVQIPDQTTSGPVSPSLPRSGSLRAFSTGDGKPVPGFRSDGIIAIASAVNSGFVTPPIIRDLDGDGIPELIIGEESASNPGTSLVRAFSLKDVNSDSLADSSFSTLLPRRITAGPVSSDSLIAVGCQGGVVYFLRRDGSLADSVIALADASSSVAGISRAAGENAFVITGPDGTVRLTTRTAAGALSVPDRTRNIGKVIVGPAVCGTSRGGSVIVLATADGSVYSFDQTLAITSGFPVAAGGRIAAPPALADIDGDGLRDIVVFDSSRIIAMNFRGAMLDHFPLLVKNSSPLVSSPVVADVDGNGLVDIIGVAGDGTTFAFDGRGRSPQGFPLQVGHGAQSAAVATRADSIIILASSGDGSVSGWLTGRTSGTPRPEDFPWPQYQRDAQRSGLDLTALPPVPQSNSFFPGNRAYNWPNPVYNGKTFIRYFVGTDATVQIKIFDLAGDVVSEFAGPGVGGIDNEVAWDVSGVQSGVYFARIEANGGGNNGVAIIKVAVVK